MDGNTLELSLGNDVEEIAAVAERIDEFCAACNIGPQVAYAVNLSVEELLTNTISYGYGDDEPHRIAIRVRLDANLLGVEMIDDARPFDPTTGTEPDLEASLEDRPVGGLGLFFADQMMDSIEYRYEDGRNVVLMTKKTDKGPASRTGVSPAAPGR